MVRNRKVKKYISVKTSTEKVVIRYERLIRVPITGVVRINKTKGNKVIKVARNGIRSRSNYIGQIIVLKKGRGRKGQVCV